MVLLTNFIESLKGDLLSDDSGFGNYLSRAARDETVANDSSDELAHTGAAGAEQETGDMLAMLAVHNDLEGGARQWEQRIVSSSCRCSILRLNLQCVLSSKSSLLMLLYNILSNW